MSTEAAAPVGEALVPSPPRPSFAARVLIALVRLYQKTLSHLIGGHCRYQPSCSHYGLACLRMHGAVRGSYYTFRRLCRCHPFHRGGFDPPPPVRAAS